MAMGLFARRHIPFFAIVAVPMIARAVSEGFPVPSWVNRRSDDSLTPSGRTFRYILNVFLAVVIGLAVFSWTAYRLKQNPSEMEKKFPVKAVQFIKESGDIAPLRIYNEYVWGGYLIWNSLPVFIDGRADLYGSQFLSEYLFAHDLRGGAVGITRFLDSYAVDGILVPPGGILGVAFLSNPDWRLAYRDATAVLFVRKVPFSVSPLTQRPERFYLPLKGNPAGPSRPSS
jgi:hypothetical protein